MSFVPRARVLCFAVLASACGSGGTGSAASGGGGGGSGSVSATSAASSTTSGGTGGSGSGGSTPGLEPSGFSCSGKKPSLTSDVIPITAANCATMAACHTPMQSGSGLYDLLVNQISEECIDLRLEVKPGDPEHSYVINKLTGRNICSGVPMPNGGSMLPAAQIQTIYDWICEGAPQN
jgi:hypothetical protein